VKSILNLNKNVDSKRAKDMVAKQGSELKIGMKDYVRSFFILALMSPSLAFAQLGGDFLDEIVEWTTNDWAVGIATIAVAVVGYIWLFSKQIEKNLALRLVLGIFFIFGAPVIVDEVRDLI
jgi:type IV secretory pathway VirB2 component (pilin)